MTITAEELKEILQQQQRQFEAAQLRLMESLTRQLTIHASAPTQENSSIDAISNSITEFHYEPDSGLIFDSWFKRYEDIFKVELKHKDDAWRLSLIHI
jgi:hypothetical protein